MTIQLRPPAQSEPAAVAPVGPIDYSNEPAIIEQNVATYRFNADGTGERTDRSVVRLQSDAVVRQFGVLSFAYASANETLIPTYVRVRKPDGTVFATDLAAVQDMPSAVTREAPLYSDQRQLQVPVRSLAVGDRLEWETVTHVNKAEAPGQFWNALNFEHKTVALNEQIELRFPASLKVTVLSPAYKAEIVKESGDMVYRWHSEQHKPSVAPPGRMAPVDDDTPVSSIPDIAWTTFPNWAAVGDWYRDLGADRATPTDELRTKAAALVAGATTDEEKIARIYSFVSMQIRYIGIDFGVGRYQPHTASEVLANGYGDCKDKHTLLAALLTAQGFHVDPVLIGANIEIDKDLPAPNSFNHIITAVELAGGKHLWLDSTSEVAPPGMLIAMLRDKDALLIPSAGVGIPTLVKTPAELPFAAYDKYDVHAKLTAEGKLSAHFDAVLHGDLELLVRATLFSGGRAQWSQFGQGFSQGMGFGGTVTAFLPTAVDTPATPLHFTYDYARDSYGDWPNHRILSLIPNALFSVNLLEKQPEKPIELGAPRIESAHSSITLPDGFFVPDLPQPTHAHSSFATFDLTYSMHGSELVTEERLQVTATNLPAAKWQEYNAFAHDIQNNDGIFLQLAEGAPQPAAKDAAKPSTALASPATTSTQERNFDATTQALLQQGQDALKAGDLPTAQARLDAARVAGPSQPGLGVFAYQIDVQKRNYSDAEADLSKELLAHPDERERLLPVMLWTQIQEKHNSDAITTLEAMRKLWPDKPELTRQEAALLTQEKRHEEAVSLLEGAALRNSSDKYTMLALGKAQFSAGRDREAQVTLETALDGTTDPGILNDAAYELADRNLDLPTAHKDAQQALELVESRTHTLMPDKLDEATPQDLGSQNLLAAVWDTLGWIDYLQGDITGADPLLHLAWINSQHAEVGYHLGMLLEKEGKPQQAFEAYTLAEAADGRSFTHADALRTRQAALQSQGLKTNFPQAPAGMLGEQRSISLPLLLKKESHADFLVLASSSSIQKVQLIEGDPLLREQNIAVAAALEKVSPTTLLPPGSHATVLRRGTLSCSPIIHSCQFVLFLSRDTRLPAAKQTMAVENTQTGSR